jgi:hypothetical protein
LPACEISATSTAAASRGEEFASLAGSGAGGGSRDRRRRARTTSPAANMPAPKTSAATAMPATRAALMARPASISSTPCGSKGEDDGAAMVRVLAFGQAAAEIPCAAHEAFRTGPKMVAILTGLLKTASTTARMKRTGSDVKEEAGCEGNNSEREKSIDASRLATATEAVWKPRGDATCPSMRLAGGALVPDTHDVTSSPTRTAWMGNRDFVEGTATATSITDGCGTPDTFASAPRRRQRKTMSSAK